MDKDKEATLNTLRAMVEEMSQFQLKAALLRIIEGMNFIEAIDWAYALGIRERNKKIKK